jgi:DNA polymerase V
MKPHCIPTGFCAQDLINLLILASKKIKMNITTSRMSSRQHRHAKPDSHQSARTYDTLEPMTHKSSTPKSSTPAQPLSGSKTKAKAKAEIKTKTKTKTAKPAPKAINGHGGHRSGAGRPLHSGKLGDTICMRIPRSDAAKIMATRDALVLGQAAPSAAPTLPIFDQEVRAGFPTPSDDADSQSKRVDLYTLFSPRPESTFLIRIAGWSMKEAGIHDGDYLVVDRSIEPRHGHIVVAYVEGQGLLAKRLRIDKTGVFLDSENKDFAPLPLGEGSNAKIWGVARAKAGLLL